MTFHIVYQDYKSSLDILTKSGNSNSIYCDNLLCLESEIEIKLLASQSDIVKEIFKFSFDA